MAQPIRGGVAASAGYRQMINSFVTPQHSDRIIRQVYCRAASPEITTGDFSEGLVSCGASLGFRTEPAIDIHEYQKNQTLVPQELETKWVWINVDRAKYFNVKIDRVDKKQICDWDEIASNFCTNASKRMYLELDPEVLMKIAIQASGLNKGGNAGVDGDVNLGQYGAPLLIDKENIVDILVDAKIVMEQQCRWEEGKMVMILPTIAERAFYGSELAAHCCDGVESALLSGALRGSYMGWRIVFSNQVPRVWDATQNRYAYYVVFGHEDATGMVQQIDDCEIVNIERSFGEYYRGLWVFGHNTLIPEAVGALFATFR